MLFYATLLWIVLALARYVDAQAVFAHFMGAESYSYTQDMWSADMKVAQGIGIDGFAINLNGNDYEIDKLTDAYAAAEALSPFKLFLSFDLSYGWSSSDIVTVVSKFANSSASYIWKDAVLVSTYAGYTYSDSTFSDIKSQLSSQGITISFAPALADPSIRDPSGVPGQIANFPSIDGYFNWWSWPNDVDANLTTDLDLAYQQAISSRSGPYIMGVSPWQFKNIDGAGDWVEYSDTLWNYRWQQAINDVKPDIVEIITWNDYGESHYIGDINPIVDIGSVQYVDGFDHAAWRTVAQYYISWYKTGSAPAISTDQVVYWYRVNPKAATCSSGTLPRNADFPADALFALSLLTDTATITLDFGSQHAEFTGGPGVTMGSVPFPTEDQVKPHIAITRNTTQVAAGDGPLAFNQSCAFYNFNPVTGLVG